MALFGFGKKNIDSAEAGQKAFEKNNIPEALRLWRISAETGHAGAIYALYSSVKEGWLPEYDKDTVRLLLKLAGEAGNTEAMDKVSGLYMGGYGVQKDREEGLRWKVKAAELGHFQAAYDLADSYCTGYRVSVDVEKDYEKALFWAKKALPLVQEDADKKGEINHIIWKCETELGLYKLGMIAFKAGDYTEALTRFSGAAEKGDTEAAKALYTMYLTGRGVAKDEKTAFGWKLKAAELGDPDAMFDVAADYLLEQEGTERDFDKALFWAKKVKQAQEGEKPDKPRDVDRLVAACRDAKRIDSFNRGLDAYEKEAYPEALTCFEDAAALDDIEAMYNLSVMYRNGLGDDKNEFIAAEYEEEAAEKGHPKAMLTLALDYYNGACYEDQDFVKALFWAKKAKQAQEEGKLEKNMPIDDLIERCRAELDKDPFNAGRDAKDIGDYDEAIRQYMRAAELGSAAAAHNLAVIYENGEGIPKDEKEAFRWYLKAAELGIPFDMYTVALGYGMNGDFTQALFWAKKAKQAQEEGKLDKKYDLDVLIRKIEQDIAFGTARSAYDSGDYAEAIQLWKHAAELGHAAAAHVLAVMYENGEGVEKDEKEAFRWRVKAAELGDPGDMYFVALGYGSNRDFTQALFWAKKAKQAQEEGKLDKKYDLDGLIRKIEQDIAFDAATVAYESGDYAEAIQLWKHAAELGRADAAHNLAMMYNTGKGVPKDEKEAFRWYVKAAELGRPDDMYIAAYSCFYGEYGAERDLKQALLWAKKAKQAQENGKLNNQFNPDKLIRDIEQAMR